MRLTVGSEEPKVYWKRRAITGGALLALVLVIIVGCRALTGGDSDDDAAPTSLTGEPTAPAGDDTTPSRDLKTPYVEGEEEEEDAPEESEPPEDEVTVCEEEALKIQVAPADETAVAGNDVPVGVIVSNNGAVDCLAPLEELRLVALAGEEEVFNSEHCDAPYQPEHEEIPSGDGEVAEFTFAGLATSEECEDDPRRLPSGEYNLVAIVDQWESEPEPITLE